MQAKKKTSFRTFCHENDIAINKKVALVILLTNFAGPLMALGRYLNIFHHLTYQYCMIALCATVLISAIELFLLSKPEWFRITKYFGLFALELIVLLLAREATIGIYICYALVPFLSCLYYDKKLTHVITICGYLVMAIALRLRSYGTCEIYYIKSNPDIWYKAFLLGFTIEYCFAAIISILITRRSEQTLRSLYEYNLKSVQFQQNLTMGFANLVESRDYETGEHIKNTKSYVRMLAEELRKEGYYKDILTDEMIDLYEQAAPLHDLGKIMIPDAILNKPAKLTIDEFEVIKTHPNEGARLIRENMNTVDSPDFLTTAINMAYSHHEKWDGSGYPLGISGTAIPLCARIMAVADVLDALLSKRPYKDALSLEESLEIIQNESGTHFEPCIVTCLMNLKEQIMK